MKAHEFHPEKNKPGTVAVLQELAKREMSSALLSLAATWEVELGSSEDMDVMVIYGGVHGDF